MYNLMALLVSNWNAKTILLFEASQISISVLLERHEAWDMPKEDSHIKETGMLVGNFELKIYNFSIFLPAQP